MNEILLNILSVVVSAVVLPLISLIGAKLVSFINAKINDEKASKLLSKATEIVTNAVRSVFQTYVEALKKNGTFDKESQISALNQAKTIVISQMTDEVKNYISATYGDLDNWLSTNIEATINTLKN